MMDVDPQALQRAVAAIYPDIEASVDACAPEHAEEGLWWHLSSTLLSSRVPFEMATAAADAIADAGVLISTTQSLASVRWRLQQILKAPLSVNGRSRRYRFPDLKAEQLAVSRAAIMRCYGSITAFLSAHADQCCAREWLVAYAPGFGPKQASMFLRNTGRTYELAILDRHVLSYMILIGVLNSGQQSVGTLPLYRARERVLQEHVAQRGFRLGLFDWAVWIVMRSLRQLHSQEAT
jgi:N-glycosylase/DNA lyase